MSSSDEEGEISPSILDFYFVDDNEEPISFSALPLEWGKEKAVVAVEGSPNIFLRGTTDGLMKVYKQVVAWRLQLLFVVPDIEVLSKDKRWIKLYRPWKCYEEKFKSTFVMVYFLNTVKRNPSESRDTIWDIILRLLRKFEDPPSEKDLVDHITLIQQVSTRDSDMAKSEYLASLLLKMHDTDLAAIEFQAPKKQNFLNDSDDDYCDENEEEDEVFDSVCAFCDDGGELLCCEGRCMRSFHPTPESGAESRCETLGYNKEEVDAIQCFRCKNCQFQMHQCYACGELGSSDKSVGAVVYPCVSATCGHFYHPKCVSKLLHPNDEENAVELESDIAAGGSFACPIHTCFLCKQAEDRKVHDMQFAICRRCPKSYHRKCLPSTIRFERIEETNAPCRAWENLLPNRVLIYCMDHKIFAKMATPARDHVLSPNGERSKRLGSKLSVEVTRPSKQIYGTTGVRISPKKNLKVKGLPEQVSSRGQLSYSSIDSRMPVDKRSKNQRMLNQNVDQKSRVARPYGLANRTHAAMPTYSSQTSESSEIKKRVRKLIESSDALFDEEEFLLDRERPNTFGVKKITLGKVMTSVEAIKAALKILDTGGSIEDAKKVCPPEIINQLRQWKRKLQIYLNPFLVGERYSSYGRHFTKVEKLKEIVDKLQWYVREGDTIVDFCCGSNDFSCLMKETLDSMGLKCSFKNYDLYQAKNDFCFEKKDWMEVSVEDLPRGRNLIMGLNPPFGVHASLANKFINKALQFDPKLLILIVPEETERLEKKPVAYELIWEDKQLLAGKSFYIPGSVDASGNIMEQWNNQPPPLYLWSHPDWAAYHRNVAKEKGHISASR